MRIQETNKILKEAKVMQHDVASHAPRGNMIQRMMRDRHVRKIAKMVAWRVGVGMLTTVVAATLRGATRKQKKKHPLRYLKLAKSFL